MLAPSGIVQVAAGVGAGSADAQHHQPHQSGVRRPPRASPGCSLTGSSGSCCTRAPSTATRRRPCSCRGRSSAAPPRGWRCCSFRWRASPALVSFPGDFLLVAYLLGVARFFTVSAALDTGSSFEGMGASREVFFSALAEPALVLALTTLAATARSPALTDIYSRIDHRRVRRRVRARLFSDCRRVVRGVPGRERANPRGRSEHAPRADHDSRGHGPGPQRPRFRSDPVCRLAEDVGAGLPAGRRA